MGNDAYFIRRRGEECAIVKLHPDGREEILEHGLTLVEAETLYFVCIGEPVYEAAMSERASVEEPSSAGRRPRQLAFKF
jgi:hypothetical protein